MNKSGIYAITSFDNKRYIGSAVNLYKRWICHLSYLQNNRHCNQHLQRTWNKHGNEAFNFEVILYCDVDNLLFYEQKVIDYYKNREELFNMCYKAGSKLGTTLSGKTREKIAIANTGNIVLEETKKKLRLINTGKVISDETRKKMSILMMGNKRAAGNHSQKGRKLSDEHKAKISNTLKGKNIRPPSRRGCKLTEKHKNALSQSLIGNTFTLGRKLSDEHKVKISNSLLRYHENK